MLWPIMYILYDFLTDTFYIVHSNRYSICFPNFVIFEGNIIVASPVVLRFIRHFGTTTMF